MKLSEVTKRIDSKLIGKDVDFYGISIDSRVEQKGKIFICLDGKKHNSQDYAVEAVRNGAVACVSSKPLNIGVPELIVRDTRVAYSNIASIFYHEPQKKMKLIAVTGTNGKTTTAYLLKKVFDKAGRRAGYIGTLFVEYANIKEDSTLTTPDPEKLYELLDKMVKHKIKYVFMEASAHALYLRKLDCICFDVSILTNISRDHLDYFGEMSNYINAKKSLFSEGKTNMGIINVDDKVGFDILKNSEISTISYGLSNPADVFAVDVEYSNGLNFTVNMYDIVFEISTSLKGSFNVFNILAVCATAGYYGIEPEMIKEAIRNIDIPGRFNVYERNGKKAVIDYAHTPDGLKKVLIASLDLTLGNVITVFGCGGDRDTGKRSEMGMVASALSDYVIITNDNPRTENELSIARQIESGIMDMENYEIVLDREEAIKRAISISSIGDVIVIAGKGAEEYMEIKGEKKAFSDREIVKKYLK